MKVEHISIRNFKRFRSLDLSFKNAELDEVSDRFLMLGDNGYGKTTILQAVALTLALATRQIRSVEDFDWVGFVPARYYQLGQPHIELRVVFTPEELALTKEVAARWYDAQSVEFKSRNRFVEPGDSQEVTLTLDGGTWKSSFSFAVAPMSCHSCVPTHRCAISLRDSQGYSGLISFATWGRACTLLNGRMGMLARRGASRMTLGLRVCDATSMAGCCNSVRV